MPRVKAKAQKRTPTSTLDASLCDEVSSKPSKRSKCVYESQETCLQLRVSTSEYHYNLGSFIVSVPELSSCLNSEYIYLKIKPDTNVCTLCWMEISEKDDVQEKSCSAVCDVPYDILNCLSSMKIFYFVTNSLISHSENLVVQVYINSSMFISLKSASEPYFNHHKKKIYKILQFFLKIQFEEYEECYLYDEEQVEKVYQSISNCYNPQVPTVPVSHDYLIPNLRMYQSQAVHWMLKQESDKPHEEKDIHMLYITLTLADGSEVFFHKYGGFFVNNRYGQEKSYKGGILADEMGLGKTLEVLACILLNPRCNLQEQLSKRSSLDEEISNVTSLVKNEDLLKEQRQTLFLFEDVQENGIANMNEYGWSSDNFKCVCGKQESLYYTNTPVKCERCSIIQHAECILYDPESASNGYKCPYCWISNTDLQVSRATLIVSPSAIIYQWEEEILRHVKKDCLKVFMYQGVEQQKFVNPSFLADHDIVLTSYETFKRELNHVDVPHGDSGHTLRHPKKFMSIPSPLSSIQWWRICLDEAQMVESVSSKTSKMAGKLHAVNRWCVTGTPIQKSVEDLYGLLLFLGIDPYKEKVWWREILWKPFVNGITVHVSSVLKEIAWRTTKKQVLDQIGLPALQEVAYNLDFSPVERVFYEKQHLHCKRDFLVKVEKADCLDVKLKSMDKHMLSKVLLPLRKLQQVCCHFQISHGPFADVQKNKMTKAELLEHLLKTSKYECEDIHRKLIMSMNGLAGIYAIKKDFVNSVETYIKVLNSIKENELNIRTDVTQQIHALFHLSNVLSECNESGISINSDFKPSELHEKVGELTRTYLEKSKSVVEICRKTIDDIGAEISQIHSKFKLSREEFPTSPWWCEVFEHLEENQTEAFFEKLHDILKNAPGNTLLRMEKSIADSLDRISFMSTIFEKSQDLHHTRIKLKRKVLSISDEPTKSVIESAISCHLRPSDRKTTKCIYCETEDIFKSYETKLFRFDANEDKPVEEENVCFQNTRRGTHADSDLELVMKFILSTSRRRNDLAECTEDGINELKLIDALKKEFKVFRSLWLRCSEYVSQIDEIEMAKITTRLLAPGEKPPNPPVPYILAPHEVQLKLVQYHADLISFQFELKKKMGQLFYLQNLKKAENKDGPFEEYCPICQQKFEKSWSVLQCGHSFCLVCIQSLLSHTSKFTNKLGYIYDGIRCAVCREFTACSDVYCIDNDKNNDKEDPSIKGSYSTKVSSIIKCLLEISKDDPTAKALVFSSFTDFLYILERALLENDIKCLNLCQKKNFQAYLKVFKESKEVNTLLIPLNFGSNGLNITEATHVLLLEPVLDYSKHLQAVGRVHRIGQTRSATVHEFIVSKTIDENIYNVIKNSSSNENNITAELTLGDLKHVFE